ncbi:MAG: molybdopterin synthase catalytic subunit [Actinomycetota bacterium]|nr:molybdopterin synthase catalytic subunit [Actinomycetota bacterium]
MGLTADPLPLDDALRWAGLPSCGAAVLFTGNVRDFSPGRPGVTHLTYEAYEEEVEPRLAAIAADARLRWPDVVRLVLLHRTGELAVGESSVVVVAASPHRDTAFEAARYCIDTLKATVPIWKRETWAGGDDWSASHSPIGDVGSPAGSDSTAPGAAALSEAR